MPVEASDHSMSIVFVGAFNPMIFHPSWFGTNGLLPTTEVESAHVEVVHAEVAQFSSDWLTLNCTRSRLSVASSHTNQFEPLRDLAVGTMELLRHTPVSQLGVNHDCVITFPNRDSFDGLGWALVPADNWPSLKRPGMAMLVEQGEREDSLNGYVRVQIEPNIGGPTVARIKVNDHFEIDQNHSYAAADTAVDILRAQWSAILERSDRLLADIVAMIPTGSEG